MDEQLQKRDPYSTFADVNMNAADASVIVLAFKVYSLLAPTEHVIAMTSIVDRLSKAFLEGV